MPTSQNGYTANDVNLTSVRTIPGTERKIRLRNGPAGDLLTWVLAQFHKLVEDLDDGQLDDWGYAERPIRGSTTVLSNHASGTAADANATQHPQGTNPRDNFTPAQIDTIHAIIGRTQGCVRWGGDYTPPAPKDGMHFEIVRGEAACAAALAAVTSGEEDDDMQLTDDVRLWAGHNPPTYSVEQCLANVVGWGEELGKRLATLSLQVAKQQNVPVADLAAAVIAGLKPDLPKLADVDEAALAQSLADVLHDRLAQ